ncbi:hypothetical protein PPL_11459 [Heterostelium album PN500]|uniref:Ankyrin repeat protein n=1 Tax=Heterostelium pallidum (strain ATCC 26659 / Pp 5 / PN500) TaxID=670386 RepID=D3BTG5_HETP5|nr:hypothetical protein PPL_11459 [Heterostelium album PN500]EFA75382.1 hypothetical protein PPL_11459 [Heterostelium album PN500]|eukprot:XP_020427516.1 hypothetical protein PPL_11459 [Heterostelium album PN500]
MDTSLFLSVCNNKIFNRFIFNSIKCIRDENFILSELLYDGKCIVYRWNEMIESPQVMAGNGYIGLLKQWSSSNSIKNMKPYDIFVTLVNAIRANSIEILRYLIEDQNIDSGIIVGNLSGTKYNDLLYYAVWFGRFDIIKYLESYCQAHRLKLKYRNCISKAPFSQDIEILK